MQQQRRRNRRRLSVPATPMTQAMTTVTVKVTVTLMAPLLLLLPPLCPMQLQPFNRRRRRLPPSQLLVPRGFAHRQALQRFHQRDPSAVPCNHHIPIRVRSEGFRGVTVPAPAAPGPVLVPVPVLVLVLLLTLADSRVAVTKPAGASAMVGGESCPRHC